MSIMLKYKCLDRPCRGFLGEQTEHESSEQLLTELAEGDLFALLGLGDRGLAAGLDLFTGGDERRDINDLWFIGDLRDIGERRLTDVRRGGGERGDLRPIGDLRIGGDRGDLKPVCERERLRRTGDGDDDPSSIYKDLYPL